MKLSKLTVSLVVGLGVAFNAMAGQITPAKGVSILMVNGVEAESKMEPSPLKVGVNQVVVEMAKMVGSGNNSEYFTSSPYIITFEIGDQDVEVNHPKVHSMMHAEKVFKHSPEWRLTSHGEKVAHTSDRLKGKQGILPYSGMDKLVAEYNQENAISLGANSLAVAAVAQTTKPEKKAKGDAKKEAKQKTVSASEHPKALEQLQAWYLKASQEDRKAFRKWMVDQD